MTFLITSEITTEISRGWLLLVTVWSHNVQDPFIVEEFIVICYFIWGSHRLWYRLASLYVAYFFLSFLVNWPKKGPSFIRPSKTFLTRLSPLKMCPCYRFFLSRKVFKSFLFSFTWPSTYSLVMWSFQLIVSILRHVHISKASNLSLRTFLMSRFTIHTTRRSKFAQSFWK